MVRSEHTAGGAVGQRGMAKAYSYKRWSTPEQGRGDSLRRQMEAAQQWATANGFELDTELTLTDSGMSAFHGKNAAEGALAEFLRAVMDGRVPAGSYLI